MMLTPEGIYVGKHKVDGKEYLMFLDFPPEKEHFMTYSFSNLKNFTPSQDFFISQGKILISVQEKRKYVTNSLTLQNRLFEEGVLP